MIAGGTRPVREKRSPGEVRGDDVGTLAPLQPRAPRWVEEAIARGSLEMFTAVVPDAAALSAATLRANVATAYSGSSRPT